MAHNSEKACEKAREEVQLKDSLSGRKGMMIMAQVFSIQEFINMLKSESRFAREAVSSMKVVFDPNGVLEAAR